MEPSTSPTLPMAYEVAKLGEDSDERFSLRPRGVSKSKSAGYIVSCRCGVLWGHICLER
jgi:hypothetical protein